MYFSTTHFLVATILSSGLLIHAQKFTTTTGGQTLVETVSVDQWDETWTMILSTVGANGVAVGAGGGGVVTTSTTSSQTDVFSASVTTVTHSVSAGTIDNYSAYQSSVNAIIASESRSVLAAAATVSGVHGINGNSATSRSGRAATGVSVAVCLLLALAAGALVVVI